MGGGACSDHADYGDDDGGGRRRRRYHLNFVLREQIKSKKRGKQRGSRGGEGEAAKGGAAAARPWRVLRFLRSYFRGQERLGYARALRALGSFRPSVPPARSEACPGPTMAAADVWPRTVLPMRAIFFSRLSNRFGIST